MTQSYLQTDSGDKIGLAAHPIALGRHPDNDVVVRDDLASRFHCVIEPVDDGYRVRDLGSRNGTRVNTIHIETQDLKPGDTIAIGTSEYTYRVNAAKPAKAPARGMPARSISGEQWALDLHELIRELPPKSTGDEHVVIIDARNKRSEALAGQGKGPEAVRLLLVLASKSRATDIHLEPKQDIVHLRIRVDGQMVSIADIPRDVGDLASGLVRTACQVKTAGRDAMLDGHFSADIAGHRVDYRVSFSPSVHGQKIVIRVLDLRNTPTSLDNIGLTPYNLDRLRKVCQQDAGMVLVCGPTGSGKTTTLYNAMREIDRDHRNVITIEDPVEYYLEGVTQMPIDEAKGNTFSSLLRSVLRQDPDVILLGEIRDEDTARTAMRAAMTGHLVFSTVHAKDTLGSIFRLLDLGVEPYLVANSLNLIVAQRLVRVLCERCKQSTRITPTITQRMGTVGQGVTDVCTPVGCSLCLRTGFRGRRAVMEMLDMDDELRDIILNNPSITAMKRALAGDLFTSLEKAGWQLVAQGITSVDEVERVMGA
ncbi:MAG: ATPase, T2SS/T4P/T4SS family [Phycisphaerales bacterium JB043]